MYIKKDSLHENLSLYLLCMYYEKRLPMKIINPVTRINPVLITTVRTLLRADAKFLIPKNPAIPIKNRIIAKQRLIFNNAG